MVLDFVKGSRRVFVPPGYRLDHEDYHQQNEALDRVEISWMITGC